MPFSSVMWWCTIVLIKYRYRFLLIRLVEKLCEFIVPFNDVGMKNIPNILFPTIPAHTRNFFGIFVCVSYHSMRVFLCTLLLVLPEKWYLRRKQFFDFGFLLYCNRNVHELFATCQSDIYR